MSAKFFKKIINFTTYLAVLVGLIFIIPAAMSYFLETSYPMAAITSGSMWPTLKRGDLVLIKGIKDKEKIDVSDIIVYQNSNGFTIHRIIELKKDSLITKGDANNISDSPIRYEEVIGQALTIKGKIIKIPSLGFISVLANQR